jgi:hypothetical protein
MKAVFVRRVCWGAMLSFVLASALLQQATGQTPEKTAPAAKVEKKEKLTGRLPPYFADVVSKEQRTKIYEIQTRYGEQLKKLRDELDALDQKQHEEVMAVLSAEQRDHVAKRTADAKAKRSKKEAPAPVPAEQSGN